MVPVMPYYVEEPQQQSSYQERPQDYGHESSNQRITIDAQTLMMIARGDFRQPGGYSNNNNNRKPPPNQNPNNTEGPCFECGKDHWVRDCPVRQEKDNQARIAAQLWPRVPRYCAECSVSHLSMDCPVKWAEKPYTPTSLGMIGVIPSPSSSENEGESTPLFVVTQTQAREAKAVLDQMIQESQAEPVLRELSPKEQEEAKRKQNQKGKAKNKGVNLTSSSGNDSSDTGSWDSIILETPEGVRREYIIKTSEAPIPVTKPAPVLVMTRAKAKEE